MNGRNFCGNIRPVLRLLSLVRYAYPALSYRTISKLSHFNFSEILPRYATKWLFAFVVCHILINVYAFLPEKGMQFTIPYFYEMWWLKSWAQCMLEDCTNLNWIPEKTESSNELIRTFAILISKIKSRVYLGRNLCSPLNSYTSSSKLNSTRYSLINIGPDLY